MPQGYENKGGTADTADTADTAKGDSNADVRDTAQLTTGSAASNRPRRRWRWRWRWVAWVAVVTLMLVSHHVVSGSWRVQVPWGERMRDGDADGCDGTGGVEEAELKPPLSDTVKAYFESPEHRMIADLAILPFASGNVSGGNFSFPVSDGKILLSYGQIVALAGDFYSNWAFQDCPAQVSDSWNVDPRISMEQFSDNVNALFHNTGGYIACILDTMMNQAKQVEEGPDPAQRYYDLSGVWGYDGKYGYCTNGGYLYIALCNWDHFGMDAVRSYIAGHTVALEAAVRAHSADSEELLKTAYFYEAFAQHFLTDLFSAGHLRAPRRELHRMFGLLSGNFFSYDPWPADKCSQAAHDEDSANGLWVRNKLGESWAVYGDKQILSAKSNANLEHVVRAIQKGLEEIYHTFSTGKMVEQENYHALDLIPNVENLENGTNFPALFDVSGDGRHLLMRTEIHARNVSGRRHFNLSSLEFDEWTDIYTSVEASPPFKVMYPLTLSPFMPETNVTQIRQDSATSNFVISKFGPQWTRNFTSEDPNAKRRSWNMLSQDILKPVVKIDDVTWRSAKSLDPHVYSLIGSNETSVVHVGICDQCGNNKSPSILWVDVFKNPDPEESCDVCYGEFSHDSNVWGMIKACNKNETGSRTRYEVWTVTDAPRMISFEGWETEYKPHMFTLRSPNSNRDTFVAAAYDNSTSSFRWSFTTWSDGYLASNSHTFEERNVTYPYQEIITGELTPGGEQHIFRMSYGTHHGKPGILQLDVLRYTPDADTPVTTISTADFPIVWNAQYEDDYLLWFLTDVDGDGRNELVAYVDHAHNDDLITLVFRQRSDSPPGRFVDPRVTLMPPNNIGKDFNGPYFANVASRSSVVDGRGGGILQVLDYYGVMGARVLRPEGNGTGLVYVAVGQVPAIAGQISSGLGWTEGGKDGAMGYFFDGV